jgi:hypothetical protein
MTTLFSAPSVDPAKVTATDIAAILAEHDINTSEPAPTDFFRPGVTYRRNDEFRCLAVGWIDLVPVALGLLPINLGSRRTWEFGYLTRWDWQRGWTKAEA